MRIARVDDRLSILVGDLVVDVQRSSGGRFSADPDDVFPRWDEFVEWADQLEPMTSDTTELDHSRLGSPSYVAGVTVGQDISERDVQLAGPHYPAAS